MNWKKKVYGWAEIILLILIVGVGIYNSFKNDNFWELSLPQVLTLIVAIVFAFGASQYRNDERKAKEQSEKVIEKIQNLVNQSSFYNFPPDGDAEAIYKQNRLACRKLSNCIVVLKDYSKIFGFEKELEYIEGEIKEYNDLVSEHPDDLDYLSKSEGQFKKRAENIDSKCDQIIVMLYK